MEFCPRRSFNPRRFCPREFCPGGQVLTDSSLGYLCGWGICPRGFCDMGILS